MGEEENTTKGRDPVSMPWRNVAVIWQIWYRPVCKNCFKINCFKKNCGNINIHENWKLYFKLQDYNSYICFFLIQCFEVLQKEWENNLKTGNISLKWLCLNLSDSNRTIESEYPPLRNLIINHGEPPIEIRASPYKIPKPNDSDANLCKTQNKGCKCHS